MADFGRTTSSRIAWTEATLEALQKENADLKKRLDQIQENRRESDAVVDKLFGDEKFVEAVKERLRELKI